MPGGSTFGDSVGHPVSFEAPARWRPSQCSARSGKISCEKVVISKDALTKPECWDVVVEYASKLGYSFPYLRADFYITNRTGTCREKVVIGEMTFSPMGGGLHYNMDFERIFGKYFTFALHL